ncbi:hypothetical protein BH11ARM1_BH11ARM1_02620 [soil metagenome]
MKLRLLGTGAADGIPSMYGDDAVSRYAKEHGGKDIRSRAAAILDGHLKIDLPPDTLMQLQRDRLSTADWSALIFTHSDDDHLAVSEIQYSMIPFTTEEELPYPIYCNPTVAEIIEARYPRWPIEIVLTHSFECYEIGAYRMTPVKATHISGEDCQNLIFEKDGRTLLYATDTGVWREETWNFLKSFKLDALVIECTDGFDTATYEGHLDLNQCVSMVDRLRTMGVLEHNSVVATTHHSVRGQANHAQLEEALGRHSILAGFDGMEIDV